ncbi:MAG: hypothetical protein M3417_00765 [Actinomycetota bacterium]|nr:hypothetical protein [Actinomycetota bacterium]
MIAAIRVGDSVQQGLDSFFAFIPNLVGFLVILIVGYLVAKIARKALDKILEKTGVDRALHQSDAGQYVEKASPGSRPSHLIGFVAFWFIFLFAVSAAVGALKIAALTDFIAQVQSYLPNVIAAVLIFVVAAAVAGAAGAAVHKLMGDTPTGKMVRAIVPVAAKMLADAYDAGQRNSNQVKQDVQTGKARAQQQAEPRTGTGNPGGAVSPGRL